MEMQTKTEAKWMAFWLFLILTVIGLLFVAYMNVQNVIIALQPDPQDSQWAGLGFILIIIFGGIPTAIVGSLFALVVTSLTSRKTILDARERRIIKVASTVVATLAVVNGVLLLIPSFIIG